MCVEGGVEGGVVLVLAGLLLLISQFLLEKLLSSVFS